LALHLRPALALHLRIDLITKVIQPASFFSVCCLTDLSHTAP
jgi:hypothetical protein